MKKMLAEARRAPRLEPVRRNDESVSPAGLERLERRVREEEPEVHLPGAEAPADLRRASAGELALAVLLAAIGRSLRP